jgi:hypothetical protein
LRVLNPRVDFARAGTELTVANVPEMPLQSGRPSVEGVPPPNPPKASNNLSEVTIVVDKPARNVRVHDRDGKFLAFYPATIGSEERPAPSGDFKVKGVSWFQESRLGADISLHSRGDLQHLQCPAPPLDNADPQSPRAAAMNPWSDAVIAA